LWRASASTARGVGGIACDERRVSRRLDVVVVVVVVVVSSSSTSVTGVIGCQDAML